MERLILLDPTESYFLFVHLPLHVSEQFSFRNHEKDFPVIFVFRVSRVRGS